MTESMKDQFFALMGTEETQYLDITEDIIDDLLEHGMKDMVAIVTSINPAMLDFMAMVADIATNPTDCSAYQRAYILGVTRDYENVAEDTLNVPVREVPFILSGALTNPNSIHFAFKEDPGRYFKGKDLYIIPAPTSEEKAHISRIVFGVIDCATHKSISEIPDTNFPDELTHSVLLFAVVQGKIREFGVIRRRGWDDISSIFGTAIVSTTPCNNVASKVINHNLGFPPTYRVIKTNGDEIHPSTSDDAPTYNQITFYFTPNFTGNIYLYSVVTGGGLLEKYENALPTWSSPTPPSIAAFTPSISLTVVPSISAFTPSSVPTVTITAPGITGPDISGGGGDEVITTLPADLALERFKNAMDQAADFVYKYWDEDAGPAAPADDIALDVFQYLTGHDTEHAKIAADAAATLSRVGETEIKAQIEKTKQWIDEVTMLMTKFRIQVESAAVDVEALAQDAASEVRAFAALVSAEADGYVGENSAEARNYAARVTSEAEQIAAEAVGYAAEWREKTNNYLGEVQDEFQRNTTAIQTAQTYLDAIRMVIEGINVLYRTNEIKVYEIEQLQKEYLRRIYAFCRVPLPQQQQERR